MDIPFSRFSGRLKQLHISELADVFDVFFPRFRTEHATNSLVTRGRARMFFGNVAMSGDSVSFIGRGRERRFAGDEMLPRQRYHCLEDSPSNSASNNTLLRELFAYAEPRLPIQPELLDTTVDTAKAAQIARHMGWDCDVPSIYHIVAKRDSAWQLPPAMGIPVEGAILRYPLSIIQATIERCVDLRMPGTLQWLFETFVAMEVSGEGAFDFGGKERISTAKDCIPVDRAQFVLSLLSQNLGGGTPFIQGIGSWLRFHGAEGLNYPSARADSRSVVRSGIVEESYGYVLVDYRAAPVPQFQASRLFGGLPKWRERVLRSVGVESAMEGDAERLEVRGVRRLQETRFAVFHDWTVRSLNRAHSELQQGEATLEGPPPLALRKPSVIIGPAVESILGDDQWFLVEEGGGLMAQTGFLVEWRNGTTADFLGLWSSLVYGLRRRLAPRRRERPRHRGT